jgi:hypothetical protein
MRLLKFHWVATYGFVPVVIALILAVVLVSVTTLTYHTYPNHHLHSLHPFDEFFKSDTVEYRAKATIE